MEDREIIISILIIIDDQTGFIRLRRAISVLSRVQVEETRTNTY